MAELQGEWAELVCDVSRGSYFSPDDERVKTLRPQRDCSEETFTSVPYRCVAANCRNVVDLFKCIFVHNLFLWRLNNHFMKVQQAKWEPIQATVFQEYALMETVN